MTAVKLETNWHEHQRNDGDAIADKHQSEIWKSCNSLNREHSLKPLIPQGSRILPRRHGRRLLRRPLPHEKLHCANDSTAWNFTVSCLKALKYRYIQVASSVVLRYWVHTATDVDEILGSSLTY